MALSDLPNETKRKVTAEIKIEQKALILCMGL